MRKLANELGVSHNLISHYYSSKDELWRACVDYSIGTINRELVEMAARLQEKADVLEVLRAVSERFIHLAARFPANLFIVSHVGASESARLDYLYTQLMEPAQRGWAALVERAVAERKIRRYDPRTLFFLLTHGGAAMFTLVPLAERMGGPPPLDPAFIDKQARDVVDILLRGIMLDPDAATRRRRA
ncbi:MAG TPA: TetR/AcrR family transcriptional regulator [Candidatus Limnocylindrales bacterium]|nr:TetR/AcrR family transcriptional regulator [Candidatus Limnocylindrales bacterium]